MKSYGRTIITSVPLISKTVFHKLWCTSELSGELAKNIDATKQLVEILSKVAFPEWSPEEPK